MAIEWIPDDKMKDNEKSKDSIDGVEIDVNNSNFNNFVYNVEIWHHDTM